ncbi:MAG: DHH family phosphoesterase [Thermodesulfobacteriota bacterium]
MDHPFSKSVSAAEKIKKLFSTVNTDDAVAVLINADPDALSSAMALKRILWRKVRKTNIYRINVIKRADNLAMVKLLKVDHQHIRSLNAAEVTRWAIVDSQPNHNTLFGKYRFDIIIDHHPPAPSIDAPYVDIREDYGATSTLMIEYLRAAKIKPSPRLATALFYGIKTDTENFARPTAERDIKAFRYLYPYVNTHIIKKIESSEFTKQSLARFRDALDRYEIIRNRAFVHMGTVKDPDVLVMIADFFLKVAEASWSIVSGVYGQKLIVIFRNAGFRRDAGKAADEIFGKLGTAGGHKSAARAEVPLQNLEIAVEDEKAVAEFVQKRIRNM